MKTSAARIVLTGSLAAITALGHYTWVSPVQLPLEVGKTSAIRISHGHKFPQSEEAINASQVDLFVLAPSGARMKLETAVSGTAVAANYAVKETGLHRIVLVQDRGITSRTPKGLQSGGRDKHSDAIEASRMVRSAVAYAPTSKVTAVHGKPAGLAFELVGDYSDGAWQLQLLKEGKGLPMADIEVFMGGSLHAVSAGKTGSDGRLTYKPPAGTKGPTMFISEMKDQARAGAKYDFVNYSTSLYVSW